ncbi:MAG: hypothetical protein GXO83_09695 [Chlorobi bacterium]|nr:hypothetical protein [Chlorobiota bacterium]
MKKVISIFTFFLFFLLRLSGQGEIDDQQRIFYRNEATLHASLNSTGFGGGVRYGKRLNFFNKRLYEGEISYFKHPKEIRLNNPYFPNSRSFVYGKLNLFFNLRGGYGFQREVFKKLDKGGVAVRYFYTFGPSIGIYKPVYYEVLVPVSLYEYQLVTEKFNPALHKSDDIYGRASFLKGWNELKIVPGIFGKFGINFEFSKFDPLVQALEAGIVIDVYPKKIPIMASNDNRNYFISLYACYRFGKIIDRYYKKAYNESGNNF